MLLGKGCNSEVFAVDDNTVMMRGKFRRDMFKLAIHALIGKLRSIQLNGETYSALIERMYDDRFMSESELDSIYDLMDTVDRLNLQNHDGLEFLSKLSQQTTGSLSTVANFVMSLGLSLNQLDFWVDNDTQNWMIDNAGNPIPFDLFDFAWEDLTDHARNVISSLLSQYIVR